MWPSEALLLARTLFSSTNNIDWRSKKEGRFSFARMVVLSPQTVMWGRRGIFAPSHHPPHLRLLRRVNHKGPWSSRVNLWWTCPFVGHCSTLGGVETFLRLWPPRKSSLDFPMFPSCLGFSNVVEHVVMDACRQQIRYSACDLFPCWIFGSHWVGSIFLCSFDVAWITLTDKV